MNTKSRSKSSLFLMELIIVIMFFSISAAICMKVFASAKEKTDFSRDMSNASFAAETIAENYKEYSGDLSVISKKYGGTLSDGGILTVYYDSNWEVVTSKKAVFCATITPSKEENVRKSIIEIKTVKDKDLFNMVVAAVPVIDSTTAPTSVTGGAKNAE